MTHKSKLIKLLAVLFAFTLVAAACGDDDGGDSSASSSDEVTLTCLLYTSPSPRDKRQSRMPSSA